MTHPTEQYNQDQINYVHRLHQQAIAKGDVPKETGVSSFMLGCYFKLGYDEVFAKYWKGERHKVDWQGLNKRVDISDRVTGHVEIENKQRRYQGACDFDVHKFP